MQPFQLCKLYTNHKCFVSSFPLATLCNLKAARDAELSMLGLG